MAGCSVTQSNFPVAVTGIAYGLDIFSNTYTDIYDGCFSIGNK